MRLSLIPEQRLYYKLERDQEQERGLLRFEKLGASKK